jgi:hypothetical protein
MKEQMIRGVLTACLLTALGLAGCNTVGPESPRTVSLPDRTGTVSPSQKPPGILTAALGAENTNPTLPAGAVPVSITRTVERVGTSPTLPDPVPPSQLGVTIREPSSVEKPSPVTAMATVSAPSNAATASESTGHGPDYGWLSGEVERSRLPRGWRLRYTRVDEEDAHGGSVLIVGDAIPFDNLQEGQQVRVTGHLLNTDSHVAGSPYQVESLQVLSK